MTILAIDYGDRRLGLAVSDSTALIAGGLPTLERSGPQQDVTEPLRRLCREHGVERIVVGVPVNMDGSQGPRAKMSLDFAAKLREALGIEAVPWDERLTTVQADRAMLSADLSRGKRRERRDRVAAVLLLQNYLDSQRRKP
jgi:putative holliday junction resolvase